MSMLALALALVLVRRLLMVMRCGCWMDGALAASNQSLRLLLLLLRPLLMRWLAGSLWLCVCACVTDAWKRV